MKVYFLILWLSGQEPKEITYPSMRQCTAAQSELAAMRMPVSRCKAREMA